MGSYTLGEIASRIGATLRGDATRRVSGLKPVDQAGPGDLSFLAHPRYRRAAASSFAAGLITDRPEGLSAHNLILVDRPYVALAAAMRIFFPVEPIPPGVSPQAIIPEGVVLGRDVAVGPLVVLGRRCEIGDRVVLMPGVILGDDVCVGADSVLHPGVVVYAGSSLGARVTVHAGSVIGSDGFGYAETDGERTKIPQVGHVVIEDDVEIGACTTIDRATFGTTQIGRGTKIDNLVQIAHNVVIGEDSVLVAQSGVAGSTRLGRRVVMAGQAGAAGHLQLGDGSVVGARSAVLRDLPPGSFVLGHPAVDHRAWKRAQVALLKLPELMRRVALLEKARDAGTGGVRSAAAGRKSRRPANKGSGAGRPRRARRRED